MAKKKNLCGQVIANILIGVCLAVAIGMLFLPNVVFDLGVLGKETISGLKIAFGYKEEIAGISVSILNFSIMAFLAYALPVLGLLLSLLFNRAGSILSFIFAIIVLAGGVLSFFMPSFVVGNSSLEGGSLGIGAIVLAIASIVGAVLVFVRTKLK